MIASWMESVSLFGAASRFQSKARLILLFGAYGLILVRPTLTSGSEPSSLKIGPTSDRFPAILGQFFNAIQIRSTTTLSCTSATMEFGHPLKLHKQTTHSTTSNPTAQKQTH